MSTDNDQNKAFVLKSKELLKNKGYDVKTSHLYDIFSQLAGFKNWHVASSQNLQLAKSISKYVDEIPTAKIDSYLNHINNYFYDDKNNEVPFDLFDATMPAWNYSITGQTGSGKSVLLNKMLSMELIKDRKPIICVLAYAGGESFKKLTKIHNGEYIKFSTQLPNINLFELSDYEMVPSEKKINEISNFILENSSNCIHRIDTLSILVKEYFFEVRRGCEPGKKLFESIFNAKESNVVYQKQYNSIFKLKPGECIPNGFKVKTLSEIIFHMISEKNNKRADRDRIVFEKIIINLYEQIGALFGRFPSMIDLINLIKESILDDRNTSFIKEEVSEKYATFLISKLSQWTKTGKYPMFDKKTNIDFSKDFIVVDFLGLDSSPALKSIYSILIHSAIYNKMHFTKDRRKFIVRDEVFAITSDTHRLERLFFIEDLRLSRVHGFSTITTSQLPSDYLAFGENDSKCILACLNCHFIGYIFDKAARLAVNNLFKLELNNYQNKHFYKIQGSSASILENRLNPVEYCLYTEGRNDIDIMNYYLNKKEMTMNDVILLISNNRHKDDEGLKKYLLTLD